MDVTYRFFRQIVFYIYDFHHCWKFIYYEVKHFFSRSDYRDLCRIFWPFVLYRLVAKWHFLYHHTLYRSTIYLYLGLHIIIVQHFEASFDFLFIVSNHYSLLLPSILTHSSEIQWFMLDEMTLWNSSNKKNQRTYIFPLLDFGLHILWFTLSELQSIAATYTMLMLLPRPFEEKKVAQNLKWKKINNMCFFILQK